MRREDVMVRLERKTLKVEGGCWLFEGSLSDGYGLIGTGNGKEIKGTHIVAWEHFNGPVPKGQCVLHTCDVRNCWRPDHLFLGTKMDNTADRRAKGRTNTYGAEHNPNAKLDWDKVGEIRHLFAEGFTITSIASLYEVSDHCISCVVRNKTWTGDEQKPEQKVDKPRRIYRRLSQEDVDAARELYAEGDFTQQEIADALNVSRTAIEHALSGRTW